MTLHSIRFSEMTMPDEEVSREEKNILVELKQVEQKEVSIVSRWKETLKLLAHMKEVIVAAVNRLKAGNVSFGRCRELIPSD